MLINVCPDDIFWTAELFVTKIGLMMHHHEPECVVKKKERITVVKIKATVKVKMSLCVQMISSKLPNIYYQT